MWRLLFPALDFTSFGQVHSLNLVTDTASIAESTPVKLLVATTGNDSSVLTPDPFHPRFLLKSMAIFMRP